MAVDEQWLDEAKKRFGQIYSVDEYVFRALTVAEYEAFQKKHVSSAEIEEAIVTAALLAPEQLNLDQLPAGLVSGLADEITNVSGFGDPKTAKNLLEEKRAEADSVHALIKAIILAAMPAYTEEALDEFTFSELLSKVALAERVIEVQQAVQSGGTVTLELVDPNEEAKKHQAKATHHNAKRLPGEAVYDDPIAQKLKQALR